MARMYLLLLATVATLALCLVAAHDASDDLGAVLWSLLGWTLWFVLGVELSMWLDDARARQRQRERHNLRMWRRWLAEEGVTPEVSEPPASYNKEV